MASKPPLPLSLSSPHFQPYKSPHLHLHPLKPTTLISLSFSRRRRPRRNTLRNPSKTHPYSPNSHPDHKLHLILDVAELKSKTPILLLESKLIQFVDSSMEAYEDLRSLVVVEPGSNRVVVSCSDKTLRFVGGVLVWSCVGVLVVRVLAGLGLGFSRRVVRVREEVVKRRDRSLGGKEVVVARNVVDGGERSGRSVVGGRGFEVADFLRRKWARRLPGWWPDSVPRTVVVGLDREEYQRQANQLVQAIMDDKVRGKDVSEEDIHELRRICRKSGVQLSFRTENARDSLYRLSVNNVINTCCIAGSPSVPIDGEDARTFVAALAQDIGLPSPRAATIVSAAVAAQTRLWFLQAWALEMQMKHMEAIEELKKICRIHRIFPPEPSSPEMEMVARGLQKHFTIDQREFLLNKLVGVCGEESGRSAAEALGLV